MNVPTRPDGNNVFGLVVAPDGLDPVLQAVSRLVGARHASIYQSRFDGAETLRFSTDSVDFESTPLEGGHQHLLNGGVGGTAEDVLAFVRELARVFTEAGIQCSFEVYDDHLNLLQVFQNGPMIKPSND